MKDIKIIVMVERSAGNESVGNMWTDTYIFNPNDTLIEVLNKVETVVNLRNTIKNRITIQIAQ